MFLATFAVTGVHAPRAICGYATNAPVTMGRAVLNLAVMICGQAKLTIRPGAPLPYREHGSAPKRHALSDGGYVR